MSLVHDRPRCFGCRETVEYDPVFAAPCDHATCASAVFHGLCLMAWRERRDDRLRRIRAWIEEHVRPTE